MKNTVIALLALLASAGSLAATPWQKITQPIGGSAQSIGAFSNGCIVGAEALNGAVAVLMLAVLLGEDAINAFFARRNALPGMEVCTVRFLEEHYETKIAGAATQWQYSKLLRLAENDRYLVLILGKNHGQLCDKEELTGAAPEELRAFLEQRTGLTVERFR